jgi:hypothetical protein
MLGKRVRHVSLRISHEEWLWLHALARLERLAPSEILRRALYALAKKRGIIEPKQEEGR